ncbi:MAG: hypothetical protein HKP45_01155 [Winogradskyella sp.]|nr:hypothetical protein [Winogradskyella sp.]
MHKAAIVVIFFFSITNIWAQVKISEKDSSRVEQDSIRKAEFIGNLGNGFFPFRYFNLDLKYLIKYNQYEGVRTGLGGETNDNFSEKFRLNSYLVYGFRDDRFKYSIGGGIRLYKPSNIWLNLSYTDDLQETGSSTFLTDKRFFSFFEPRLLNINLFHRHITKAMSLEYILTPHLLSESQFAVSNIDPTYDYSFFVNGVNYNSFTISQSKISLQWSPFSKFNFKDDVVTLLRDGYPKFTLQYSKSFEGVFNGDFNFSKLDFRTVHQLNYSEQHFTSFTMVAGIAMGETPLTHLYHAYPNNINKQTIMNRFSVAGLNSFETMFFNEFFSDRFSTLQVKHFFKPFEFTDRFKPQLVLISRHALGNMKNIDRHQNINFNTLNQLYSEAGFEINKLVFGFGLSFAYRYGSYHLPVFEDNVAFKFTFNLSI